MTRPRLRATPLPASFAWAVALLATLLTPAASAQFGPFGKSAATAPVGVDAPAEVSVRIVAQTDTVAPGGQAVIAVVLDHQPGWHSHLNEPEIPEALGDFQAIPTEVYVAGEVPGVIAGPAQYPKPKVAMVDFNFTGDPVPYKVYGGQAVIYLPLLIDEGVPVSSPEAPSTLSVPITISYQACDDATCLIPEFFERTLTFRVVPATEAGAQLNEPDLFSGFDPTVFAAMAEGSVQTRRAESSPQRSFFGIPVPSTEGALGIVVLAVLAAAGGLILNLTPCVLPVLPIKVMTISHHAGSPGRSLFLGLWMAAGVVAFWLGIGIPAAFLTGFADPSRLFGIWWVTLAIGVLIGVMGVGIMGLFQITLPDKIYAVNPKADSAWGSFLFGVMTAVLGLPCFGFVAGALLAGSAALPPAVILVVFASIGVGMASPYLVLSANPKWIDKLPRTGPASELVKQVMGLLLIAAAVYFVGSGVIALLADRGGSLPWWGKTIHWWGIALVASLAGLWLIWRTVRITPKPVKRVVFGVIGLFIGGAAVAYATDTTQKARDNFWIAYDPGTLRGALDRGQIVVVDFTAEWCLNCKALKAAVLTREPVKSELLSAGVAPMTADLTSRNAPGWDTLRDLGQTGIPLLAIYTPGRETPWLANSYTSDQVMRAIEEARAASRQ